MQRAIAAAFVLCGWLTACSTAPPPTEVRWAKEGAAASELEADQNACMREAAGATAPAKRFDHIAKGSSFMRCMTEKGWRQVAADS